MPSAGKPGKLCLCGVLPFWNTLFILLALFSIQYWKLTSQTYWKNAFTFWFCSLRSVCDKCSSVTASSSDHFIISFWVLLCWKNQNLLPAFLFIPFWFHTWIKYVWREHLQLVITDKQWKCFWFLLFSDASMLFNIIFLKTNKRKNETTKQNPQTLPTIEATRRTKVVRHLEQFTK